MSRRTQIVALAAQHAIPTIHSTRTAAEDGGLMFYGNDLLDAYRRNGTYIGRILKGHRAADLPVKRADKFELVIITLKTAKALDLTCRNFGLHQHRVSRARTNVEFDPNR